MAKPNESKLDSIVAASRRSTEEREKGYRERALGMYPWICGRCAREFTRANLTELTVHHRNHDHDFNPPDGSNWELLLVDLQVEWYATGVDAGSHSHIPRLWYLTSAATLDVTYHSPLRRRCTVRARAS